MQKQLAAQNREVANMSVANEDQGAVYSQQDKENDLNKGEKKFKLEANIAKDLGFEYDDYI